MKYRRIPVVIEAIVWNGENVKEVKEFAGARAKIHYQYTSLAPDTPEVIVVLDAPEGEMHINKGYYIIKDVNGETHGCHPEVFKKLYEVVNE